VCAGYKARAAVGVVNVEKESLGISPGDGDGDASCAA
jgi:hypothetical protein